MYVADWMTKKVCTLSPEDSVSTAVTLLKEKRIKHIPVVKGKKVAGIFSDRDVRNHASSRADAVNIVDLHTVFLESKVKSIMKTQVIQTSGDTPIEEAAMIMLDNNIGCLPVTDGSSLVGIISDRDIFRALVDITGVRHQGHRIFLSVEDNPGAITAVSSILRKHGFRLQSILTSYEKVHKGFRNLLVRVKGRGNFSALKKELEATYIGVRIKKG